MSILDDAIREHLELKRAHGADEGEVKRLEDEAFGPPQRPDEADPFAEAPTEFLLSPSETAADLPEVGDEGARSGRRPDIADLQEAPPGASPTPEDAFPDAPPAPEDELSPAPDAPPPSPADAADAPLPPPAEEHPAGEHEIVPDIGPDTEERHAIADQPTQMFDVQAQIEAEAAEAPAEQASPTDEELVDAVRSEPQAAPPAPEEPAAGPQPGLHEQQPLDTRGPDAEVAGHPPADAEEESAEFDFFNEQRLSDELDQALEAPIADEGALPEYEDTPPAEGGVFDFEGEGEGYEDDPSEEALRHYPDPPSEETPRDSSDPPSEETPHSYDPQSEEAPPSEDALHAAEPPSEEVDVDYDPDTGHEDVLEDTPRFLEDAPEDDDLWFEQKPPKDFDLD
jgi:hypothetical protein